MAAMSSAEDLIPVRFTGLKNTENVVFFGNNLGVECQRCGAYNQTSMGHKFCAHISCPIALREFKRRKRKRTSSLEKVYMPRFQERVAENAHIPDGDLAGERVPSDA